MATSPPHPLCFIVSIAPSTISHHAVCLPVYLPVYLLPLCLLEQNRQEGRQFVFWVSQLLEKEMATHSSILSWRIPWTEEPGELQSMGSQRVSPWGRKESDTTE